MENVRREAYDICVLGGGPAGYVAAIRAAQLGAKVVLIENREIGGTCLNRGCIPTKALLKTSEVLYLLNKSKEFGIESNITALDSGVVASRKDRVVKSLRMGLEHLLSKNGIEVLRGIGKILSAGSVEVDTQDGALQISCGKLILTTGSEPLLPDIPGIGLEGVLSSDEALEMQSIPESITIIGAGAIGLEFATLYNSLRSKVTVVELMDTLLPREDKEITSELLKIMKRQGIKFRLGSGVKRIDRDEHGLLVYIGGEDAPLVSEKVLVAIGRKLNSASDGIVSLGIKTNKGAIVVDEHMQTSVSGIYALGDVIGGSLLAHLAFAEGKVAVENALGLPGRINYNAVPSCVYTNPEVASVGMSEEEAGTKGIPVKTGRFDFRNNGRALCHFEREGFVKVVTEEHTGVIIGACILGHNASELISELTLAISLGAKAEALADMIHPHPTLSEAVMEACGGAAGRAIHK